MTVEEVYTNAFSADYVAWTEYGASPYLDDTDTGYIRTNVDLADERAWSFPASAGSGTINSVKLRLEAQVSVADCGYISVNVWDGSNWIGAGNIFPVVGYGWFELDVSAILNTWAKINAGQVWVSYNKVATGYGYVRRLTRKVDYTPVVAKKPIMKMDLGPHPRSRLLFAPTLFLGAKGASSSSPPSDPWEGWFMDEV